MENKNTTSPKAFYDADYSASKSSLPDIQNAASDSIKGANVQIKQVGMHNFKLPLKFLSRNGDVKELQANITGTVSLAANSKGINMSRIMRTFYNFEERVFTIDLLEEILRLMKVELGTNRAFLKISFSYPIKQTSLRSGLEGWQYYNCSYEASLDESENLRKIIRFDFIYSSACPCSAELSEHARVNRNIYCVPHSQRSKLRVSVELERGATLFIEDLHERCLNALKTETQVMVKREDEQAFAELNGAYVKFVEDAARLVFASLDSDKRIADFEAVCVHLESLHSHDAVSVICKGIEGGFKADFSDFQNLLC